MTDSKPKRSADDPVPSGVIKALELMGWTYIGNTDGGAMVLAAKEEPIFEHGKDRS